MQITPGNLHAPSTWPLPVAFARDPCTWPHPVTPARGPGAAQLAELSRLNTSSRFRRKHNFFGAPKIRSVSTWRITWLLPFTLSIPLDQPSVFTRLTVLQVNRRQKLVEKGRWDLGQVLEQPNPKSNIKVSVVKQCHYFLLFLSLFLC